MSRRHLLPIIALALAGASLASADTQIPGEFNVQTTTQGNIEEVIDRLERIPGVGNAELRGRLDRWRLYNLKLPLSSSADEVAEVLDDALAEGVLEWHAPNSNVQLDSVVDLGGQTGSIWVSGVDIDHVGFSNNQYALDQFEIGYANSPHETSKGQGVLVAVLDTGIDASHPALLGHVSPLGINLVSDGAPDDDGEGALRGHGTFVSGLVSLVAPEARILPIKVLDSHGIGDHFRVAAGINHAVEAGAHVIVLALGANVSEPILALQVAIDNALRHGTVILAAIGNGVESTGEQACHYPASHPGVIAVGASNHRDNLAGFSNYHTTLNVLAPGETILVDGEPAPDRSIIGPLPDGAYAAASGTSLATAFAAGAAALARAQAIDWPAPESGVPVEAIGSKLMEFIMDSTTMISIEMEPPHMPVAVARLDPNSIVLNGERAPRWGDLDGDDRTSGSDLAVLLGSWGDSRPLGAIHRPDLNLDGNLDGADLSLLLGFWSAPKGAP